ncbi:MAG: DUF885 domain-containing protein [Lachnospiraceae bacterium]|nr:DUF885 domain-containing protein [Lachnospiraceae bacterium]
MRKIAKRDLWKKSRAVLCAGMSAVLLLTGCGGLSFSPSEQKETTQVNADNQSKQESAYSKKFQELTEEIFREELKDNTLNLHYTLAYPEDYGIDDYEITLGDYSMESYEEAYSELKDLKEELEAINPSQLEGEERLTYKILKDYVEAELSAEDFTLYGEVLSPTLGVQAQLPILLAEYTFRNERDVKDYLGLLGKMEETYAQIIEREHLKSENGLFMSDRTADDVILQCQQFIENPEENYLISTFNERLERVEGLSEAQKESYRTKNLELIQTDVIHAYQVLIDGLEELKGTGVNEAGLFYYPEGIRYYEYLVRTETGSANTVRRLQRSTIYFMSNVLTEMAATMEEYPNLLEEYEEYSMFDGTPEEMLAQLSEEILEDYPNPPDTIYTVKYVDDSLKEHLSPAFYLTPPIDDALENVIYINPLYMDGSLYTTLSHEGFPGHLYQTTYTNEAGLSLVRNLLGYSGYTEGWATYVEYDTYRRVAENDQPLAKISMLESQFSLALCAFIDMGVNYEGWTKKDVQEYLEEIGLGGADTADSVFYTVVQEPANYLSYFIGYLEFLKLRDQAQETLGDRFSIKEFHDFILTVGPAPFDLIEEEMENWMK